MGVGGGCWGHPCPGAAFQCQWPPPLLGTENPVVRHWVHVCPDLWLVALLVDRAVLYGFVSLLSGFCSPELRLVWLRAHGVWNLFSNLSSGWGGICSLELVRHPVWSSYGLRSSALVGWMHYFIKHKVTCTQILCVFLECSDLRGPFWDRYRWPVDPEETFNVLYKETNDRLSWVVSVLTYMRRWVRFCMFRAGNCWPYHSIRNQVVGL